MGNNGMSQDGSGQVVTGQEGKGWERMGHARMGQDRLVTVGMGKDGLGWVTRDVDAIPPCRGPPTSLSIQVLPRQVAKHPKVLRRMMTVPAPTRTKGTLVAFSSNREK